uniref:Claudin n=1 Tax=Echeneis naucrates TaxID=173247 RepID=A0A665W1V4_ECHNA
MLAACLEFLGMSLCVTGSLLVMVACGLPTWKVTAFIDSNIVVAQTIWDGLWMSCVVQSTGQMQCKVHDSVLALPQDLQTARIWTSGAISAITWINNKRSVHKTHKHNQELHRRTHTNTDEVMIH